MAGASGLDADGSSLAAALASPNPLVSFVALAEFDIDRGAVVRAKVPCPDLAQDPDREYLAEQMLPDRAEGFAAMWTVFFLNRPSESGQVSAPPTPDPLRCLAYRLRPGGDPALPSSWTRLAGGPAAEPDEVGFAPSGESPCSPRPPVTVRSPRNQSEAAGAGRSGELIIRAAGPSQQSRRGECLLSLPVGAGLHASPLPHCPVPTDAAAVTRLLAAIGDAGSPVCGSPQQGLRGPQGPTMVLLESEGMAHGLLFASRGDSDSFLSWFRGTGASAAGSVAAASPLTTSAGSIGDDSAPFTYCLCRVRSERMEGVRRGAVVKAIAIGAANPTFWECFVPVVEKCLAACLEMREGDNPAGQRALLEQLYAAVNDRSQLRLTEALTVSPVRWQVWADTIGQAAKMLHCAEVVFDRTPVPVSIPLHAPAEYLKGDIASVRRLLDVFGEQTMTILDAIVSERRVLFVTYLRSAEEVCSCVLAAVALVCPPVPGVLLSGRVFPYSSLTCMSVWQSVPGCIVGVTNPMFQSKAEWWDVLCNIDSGRVQLSTASEAAAALADVTVQPLDQVFVQKVSAGAAQQERRGVPAASVEAWVRHCFREQILELLLLARDGASHDTERTVCEANSQRFARWRRSKCYASWAAAQKVARGPVDVDGHIRRLRGTRELSEEDSILIFQDFVKHLRSEEQLLGLLAALPLAADGLYPIALGLFHRSEAVRMACVALLRRVDAVAEGQVCISNLNAYMMLAYERSAQLMPATDATPVSGPSDSTFSPSRQASTVPGVERTQSSIA